MSARFALYLAPEPADPLWIAGSGWLGFDAETRLEAILAAIEGVPEAAIREAIAHPRLYGFHVTLKAPFRLIDGLREDALEDSVAGLAERHAAFGPLPLELEARPAGPGRHFLCLVPSVREEALVRLEAEAVMALDRFRAPMSPAERERRRPDALAKRERGYLDRYGYPYVLDAYRPHFSLTGPLDAAAPDSAAIRRHLEAAFANAAFRCQSLVLFEQPEPGERFFVRRRFALAGG